MNRQQGFIIPTIIAFILISSCWLIVINLELVLDVINIKVFEQSITDVSVSNGLSYYINNFELETTCNKQELHLSKLNLDVVSNCLVNNQLFDLSKIDKRSSNISNEQFIKYTQELKEFELNKNQKVFMYNNEQVESTFEQFRLIMSVKYRQFYGIVDINLDSKQIINIIEADGE